VFLLFSNIPAGGIKVHWRDINFLAFGEDIFKKKKRKDERFRTACALQNGGSGAKRGAKHKGILRMSIDKDTARRVAHLARIRVAEGDLEVLAGELSHILGFMEQLNEVDIDGVEPMTSVTPMALPRRADVVTDGGYPEKILANAPDAREGFFAVPKVVE